MKKIILICICVLMITFGLFRGEANTIYNKAATICLECIGLGK